MSQVSLNMPKKYALLLMVVVYLAMFAWFYFNTDNIIYKIFFAVMGIFLIVGLIDKIRMGK